jgi:hypothetical protein
MRRRNWSWSRAVAAACALTLALAPRAGSEPQDTPAEPPVPSSPQAPPETFDQGFARETAAILGDLEALAEWCGSAKLYAERDHAYGAILAFDPDNGRAHRGLKHTQLRDGTWVVPEKKLASRNYAPAMLEDCRRRRAEIAGRFRERLFALLELPGARASREARRRVLEAVLQVDPDEPQVRALRGEVRRGEQWVLVETEAAAAGRERIREAVREALARPPGLLPAEPSAEEERLDVSWSVALANEDVRVLSTGKRPEAEHVAHVARAAGELVRAVLSSDVRLREGATVYLLVNPGEANAFVDALPELEPEMRERLRGLTGAGIPGTPHVARWDADEAHRLDGAVRHLVGSLVFDGFQIGLENGWLWDGIGMYLTRELCGSRLTWYAGGVAARDETSRRFVEGLVDPKTNWIQEAYQLLARERATPMCDLLRKDVSAMGLDDMVIAYAMAAWLLEGRWSDAPELLRRIGAGEEPEQALLEVLGVDCEELRERLVRWLSERR